MNWDRETLIQELGEFDWALPDAPAGPQLQAYSQHYSLNFDESSEALSHQAGLAKLGGYDIAVQRWMTGPAVGTAILVHGYYDHVGLYKNLIDFCLRQNLNVVAFDLPGHGLSGGEQAVIANFQDYDAVFSEMVEKVQASMPEPLFAFGQSTGGAILINFLLKRGFTAEECPFADVILLAPLVRPMGWRKGMILQPVVSLFLKQMKRKHGDSSSDADFLDFVRSQDPLQSLFLSVEWVGALIKWMRFIEAQPATDVPMFVVQGDEDGTVDWRHNMKVLEEKFPQRELFVLEEGRHHLVNESLAKRSDMYQHIAERLQTRLALS
jgi:alpha-beta hydrolase superfamily lysophospholipase